jgi:hypothetical protein
MEIPASSPPLAITTPTTLIMGLGQYNAKAVQTTVPAAVQCFASAAVSVMSAPTRDVFGMPFEAGVSTMFT